MGIKAILKRLFPVREYRIQPEEVRGEVIRCHDCNQFGYIAYERNGSYTISQGWIMAWVGLTPIYNCPQCQQKRKAIIRDLLEK